MTLPTKVPAHGREEQSFPAAESACDAPPVDPPKKPATSLNPCRKFAMIVAPAEPIRTSPESPGAAALTELFPVLVVFVCVCVLVPVGVDEPVPEVLVLVPPFSASRRLLETPELPPAAPSKTPLGL